MAQNSSYYFNPKFLMKISKNIRFNHNISKVTKWITRVKLYFIPLVLLACTSSHKDVGISKTRLVPGDQKEGKEIKITLNGGSHLNGIPCNPYLSESPWFLYSRIVVGGRLSTRLSVSRIRLVVAWSLAILFQTLIISSYITKPRNNKF